MLHKQALPALEGAEVGVDLPDLSENVKLLPVEGLEIAGERAFRNSVYASGGVIGVLTSSSCLIKSSKPSAGLLGNSDGSIAERGVLRPEVGCVGFFRLVAWPVAVLSEGRLETRVGVFKAGKASLVEVTLTEGSLLEVTSGEAGLGELTSGEVALGEVTVGEAKCILASDEVFTRDWLRMPNE